MLTALTMTAPSPAVTCPPFYRWRFLHCDTELPDPAALSEAAAAAGWRGQIPRDGASGEEGTNRGGGGIAAGQQPPGSNAAAATLAAAAAQPTPTTEQPQQVLLSVDGSRVADMCAEHASHRSPVSLQQSLQAIAQHPPALAP